MANGWTDKGVFEGGGSFGDNQVGDDVSHRYQKKLPNGTWVVIDHAAAAMTDDDNTKYWVDERTETILCRDPDDPGGTEIDSEYETGEGSALSYSSLAGAQAMARLLVTPDISEHLFTKEAAT